MIVGGKLLFVQGDDVQIRLHRRRVRLLLAGRILRYRDGSESADHDHDHQDLD